MISFCTESWSQVRHEIAPLWQRHHDELVQDKDRVPLAPDLAKYQAQDTAGSLHIVTARRRGALVGYVVAIVETHLHYRRTLCAFFDLYYLLPEHRAGWAGVRLFIEAERALKARGVQKLFSGTKLWQDASPIFERLGWVETERLFTRWIGA